MRLQVIVIGLVWFVVFSCSNETIEIGTNVTTNKLVGTW